MSNEETSLSSEETLELVISSVKQFPEVYDPLHPDYKNATKRASAWQKVTQMCNLPNENIAKAKWSNLREHFKRVLKDEEARTGQAAVYRKPWQYREQMEFLRDSLNYFKKQSSNDGSDDSDEVDTGEDKPTSTDVDSLLFEFLKRKQSEKLPKDSLSTFFQYLESSVRAMSKDRQLVARRRFNEILLRMEEEELGQNNHASSNVLLSQSPKHLPINFPYHFSPSQNLSTSIPNARFRQQNPQSLILNPFTSQERFPL